MSKRLPLYLIFLAVFGIVLGGSTSAVPIGAEVQTWSYDPQTNLVTVKIVNISHKDITAFNIAVKETYTDGRVEQHELLRELIGKILHAKQLQEKLQRDTSEKAEALRKFYGDGAFHPGEVRDEKFPVQPGLKDYQAVIDVVAYMDGTADSANDEALKRIIDERKTGIASGKMAAEIARAALADPNDSDPCTTAVRKTEAQVAVRRDSQVKPDVHPVFLESVSNELKRECSSNANKRDALQQLADREDAMVSALSAHAALVKTGGPQ